MKGERRRGERGTFLGLNVFFIVERLGRGRLFTEGYFFYKFMGGGRGWLKVATHGGTHGFRVH